MYVSQCNPLDITALETVSESVCDRDITANIPTPVRLESALLLGGEEDRQMAGGYREATLVL